MNKGKKVMAILGMILLIITGCTKSNEIRNKDYELFLEKIVSTYSKIDTSYIEFIGGPDQLAIDFNCNTEITAEYAEECFQEIKTFLLTEGMLDKLNINGDQYYGIKEISIDFCDSDSKISYSSYYYNPGPEGYQDNRYWTEDNINGFENWSVLERKTQKND